MTKSERNRKYYLDNKVVLLAKSKEVYESDKENRKRVQKEYRRNNVLARREYNREYKKNRRDTNVNYKLSCSLRTRLGMAVKNNQKSGSAVKDLGCSVEFLKQHLEAQFLEGMSWNNHGFGPGKWQIDHISPLCSFDLSKREELLVACNYKNLQPIWYKDHIQKTVEDVKLAA